MFCPKCGQQNENDAIFCAACGAPLAKETDSPKTDIPYENDIGNVPPTTVLTPNENSFTANQNQGYVYSGAPEVESFTAPKKKMSKGLKRALIITPIIIVLAVVIGIGSVAISKLNSPLVKIGKGFANLVKSGDAYHYDISVEDEINISADVKFDLKGKNIDVANGKFSEDDESYDFEGFLHTNDKELGVSFTNDYGKGLFYNGYISEYEDGELDYADYAYEYIAEDLGFSEEEFNDEIFADISLLFDFLNGDKSIEKDQDDIIKVVEKYTGEEIEDKVSIKFDEKIAKDVEKELKKCLTDKKWLEENLGLTVSKDGKVTTYTFEIPIEKAVNALFEITEPLLEDVYNQYVDIIEEEVGSNFDAPSFKESFDEVLDDLDGIDDEYTVNLEIEMTKGEISLIDLNIESEYYTIIDFKAEISKADDFTAIDSDDYSKDLDEIKALIKELEEQRQSYYDNYYDPYYDSSYDYNYDSYDDYNYDSYDDDYYDPYYDSYDDYDLT